MKKVLAILSVLVLIGASAVAEVDLSALDYEDLLILHHQVNILLNQKLKDQKQGIVVNDPYHNHSAIITNITRNTGINGESLIGLEYSYTNMESRSQKANDAVHMHLFQHGHELQYFMRSEVVGFPEDYGWPDMEPIRDGASSNGYDFYILQDETPVDIEISMYMDGIGSLVMNSSIPVPQ